MKESTKKYLNQPLTGDNMQEKTAASFNSTIEEIELLIECLSASIQNLNRNAKYSCEEYVCTQIKEKLGSIAFML